MSAPHALADARGDVEARGRVDAAGRASIPAEVTPGTQRDAILASCSANGKHGMRRTNADKRNRVLTLLGDAEWAKWSDREIARQCEVSADLVGAVRRESLSETIVSPDAQPGPTERTFIDKHGNETTMKVDGIGKGTITGGATAGGSEKAAPKPPAQPKAPATPPAPTAPTEAEAAAEEAHGDDRGDDRDDGHASSASHAA